MEKEKWFEFITEYTFKDKKYSATIIAQTTEEAEQKLKAKKETEVILGYDPTKPIKI